MNVKYTLAYPATLCFTWKGVNKEFAITTGSKVHPREQR